MKTGVNNYYYNHVVVNGLSAHALYDVTNFSDFIVMKKVILFEITGTVVEGTVK